MEDYIHEYESRYEDIEVIMNISIVICTDMQMDMSTHLSKDTLVDVCRNLSLDTFIDMSCGVP